MKETGPGKLKDRRDLCGQLKPELDNDHHLLIFHRVFYIFDECAFFNGRVQQLIASVYLANYC